MSRRAAKFTEADAFRAIKAIKRSGEAMAVEITPDGTIRIIPAPPPPEITKAHKPKVARRGFPPPLRRERAGRQALHSAPS